MVFKDEQTVPTKINTSNINTIPDLSGMEYKIVVGNTQMTSSTATPTVALDTSTLTAPNNLSCYKPEFAPAPTPTATATATATATSAITGFTTMEPTISNIITPAKVDAIDSKLTSMIDNLQNDVKNRISIAQYEELKLKIDYLEKLIACYSTCPK
jgi:hypothetical protein